ncbi:MAG: hypothetical protein EOM58_01470 [Clostridia bacterium]|nr:hypothetical protein [Clostridia bacterium]
MSNPWELNTYLEYLNRQRLGTQSGLVWGGAVYESIYLSSFPRILFLLKESNCQTPNEVWSLPQHLRNQVEGTIDGPLSSPRLYNIWKFVGCMVAGITGNMPSYQSISSGGSDNFDKICKRALSRVAVLNIKKTPGTSESDSSVLLSYVQQPQHLELLMEEIRILSPHLVICGGTYDILTKVIKRKHEVEWSTGAKTFTCDDTGSIFLDLVHPSVRGIKRNVLYTYLQCVYYDLMHEYHWDERR